jgi:hypothetical protein
MPDPTRLIRTLHQAVQAFRRTPGRQGRFVQLPEAESVLVVGDLHGNVENFKRVLEIAQLGKQPRRHLVLQELIHGPQRYPNDGGDQSHRLLDLMAALKCQYLDRVHVLLGNHELSQWTARAILKADEDLNQLFRLGVTTAYGSQAEAVYAAYEQVFEMMAVAVRTPNRVFLSHSLPAAKRLDGWDLAQLRREMHWEEDFKLGGCIHAVVWGRDTSEETAEKYLQKVECDLLITGHIPCDEGFQIPNPKQLILDAKDAKGCACLFPADRPVTQQELLQGIHKLLP